MISTTRSYCSCDIPDDRSGQALGEVFGVIDMRAFKEKYRQAVSGSGKEYRRIATLLSSSLCALLHFYNVTDDNPLTLQFTVGINDTQMSVTCTDSIFEYKSPVTAGPSNMDIVLSGKDDRTGKDTLVFLESKFSEYITDTSSKFTLRSGYLDNEFSGKIYRGCLSNLGLEMTKVSENEAELRTSDGKSFYIGGIKQMISHYVGMRNLLKGSFYDGSNTDKGIVREKINSGAEIILGEILFDDRIGAIERCLRSYEKKYQTLSRMISKENAGCKRFHMMTDVLHYSLFKENTHQIEPRIKRFYGEDR